MLQYHIVLGVSLPCPQFHAANTGVRMLLMLKSFARSFSPSQGQGRLVSNYSIPSSVTAVTISGERQALNSEGRDEKEGRNEEAKEGREKEGRDGRGADRRRAGNGK